MVAFYLILYYMMYPLTGPYGENNGAAISTALFLAAIRPLYAYLANAPWVQGDDHSKQDKAKV
jgi:hypothetical protein